MKEETLHFQFMEEKPDVLNYGRTHFTHPTMEEQCLHTHVRTNNVYIVS